MKGDKRIPEPIRALGRTAVFFFGGLFTLSVASSVTIQSLKYFSKAKRRTLAQPCKACKGKGFYACKLCKGKSTIDWSSTYDPIFINPCLCPTCEGIRVQSCLNCLGKGYA